MLKVIGPVYLKKKLYEMNELVDDCMVTSEKFHEQYIIIPSLLLDPLLIEE